MKHYEEFRNNPGLIIVRDRYYNPISIQATDNIRARINYLKANSTDIRQYEAHYLISTKEEILKLRDKLTTALNLVDNKILF